MSYEKIDRHYKRLQTVSKSWDEAIEKAKTKARQPFNDKRTELREKLNKFRGDEQQLISDYQRTEMNLNQESQRIAQQITSLESQATAQPLDPRPDMERKNQQLDQIYGETHKEMVAVLDKYRDKVKRFEQILAQNADQEKKLTNLGAQIQTKAVTPMKAILDLKDKNMSEVFNKLQQIREDIEKKIKELAEIERKEAEEIENSENNCIQMEIKERNEEMNKFMHKIRDSLKKH